MSFLPTSRGLCAVLGEFAVSAGWVMRGLLDCTAFALLAGHSFFKLRTIPRPRAGDGISVPLRGGTPMRTWTRLTLAALLALPFTLAPLLAADPEETTEQKVKRLEK